MDMLIFETPPKGAPMPNTIPTDGKDYGPGLPSSLSTTKNKLVEIDKKANKAPVQRLITLYTHKIPDGLHPGLGYDKVPLGTKAPHFIDAPVESLCENTYRGQQATSLNVEPVKLPTSNEKVQLRYSDWFQKSADVQVVSILKYMRGIDFPLYKRAIVPYRMRRWYRDVGRGKVFSSKIARVHTKVLPPEKLLYV